MAGAEERVPHLQKHRIEDLKLKKCSSETSMFHVRWIARSFTDAYYFAFWSGNFAIHLRLGKELKKKKQREVVL
jgi:hypothetical protein